MSVLKGGILVDKIKVLIFVEDNAQEKLIPPLFRRLAAECGVDERRLEVRIPYSRGGAPIGFLMQYLDDYAHEAGASCIILGSDGNCKGFAKKRKELEEQLKKYELFDQTIIAIPDPHIERWYLIDHNALSAAVGASVTNHAPKYKCSKGAFKKHLREAIVNAGVKPLQGGAEYGEEVAAQLDLYRAGKEDHGFNFFVQRIKDWAATQNLNE